MLIYDCEIKKAILSKTESPIEGIEYCEGWRDFEGMGISCIGAYDYHTDRYRVFCEDNFPEFQALVDSHEVIIGFNSIGFDNPLCAANGIVVPDEKSYDALVEVWLAAGLGPMFRYPSHMGFGLDAICKVNFGLEKSGHGAVAPVQWQRGQIGSVIDYCLNDVKITKRLTDCIEQHGTIKDPTDTKRILTVRRPSLPK
jgi:hypothetical protein